jgi:hypothetical protein
VTTAEELICAALRGEHAPWPWSDAHDDAARVFEQANAHGVCALLHARVASADWPPSLLQSLRNNAIELAMWEARHQRVLAKTLAGLDAIGVRPVLVKGTALAYSLYADAALRTRGDTDLIIPFAAKEEVHVALLSLGFERVLAVSGEFVSYQASYVQQASDGSAHTLDLHWKINNSELLSRLFTYDELAQDAEPLPRLCAHAFGASRVHALLLACMHRSTHKQNPYYVNGEAHHDANRLIWLYDIHLLAGQLNGGEWEELVRLAESKGLRAVCLEGMENAQARFHTKYPEAVLQGLATQATPEPPALYLAGGKLRQQWMDFQALGSFTRQLRYLRELVFPSAEYMRSHYAASPSTSLWWLYIRRALGGVVKRMRPRAAAEPQHAER